MHGDGKEIKARRACGRLSPKSVYCGGLYFNPYLLVLLGRLTELLNFITLLLLQANRLLDRSHLLTA
ncbi:hypothetical protein [uncultured Campylobacter sp.]|uniref:hypothetical protein n=1 Tax=uncultured Campylobacter sp. TaxID=218934 RepID=UPI00262DC646|nr:hypothetical protein [uncultured Campylobacter sp.]